MHKAGYLGYIHSFRGFAILNVVAVHALALAIIIPRNWAPDPTAPLSVLNETLFHDSTLYFALISGLLFASILRARGYASFCRSKAMYVLLPYIVCTIVFSLMRWDETGNGVLAWPTGWPDYIDSILPNLIHGEAQFTFWYIPVLLILFAITPLLSALTAAKSYAALPAWAMMLAPLAFSRPDFVEGTNQIVAGTIIYFAGAYTVGVYLGHRLEPLLDRIAAYRNHLIAAALLSSAILVELQLAQINRFGSYSLQETFFYLQKMSLAALVLLCRLSVFHLLPARLLHAFAGRSCLAVLARSTLPAMERVPKRPGVLHLCTGDEPAGGTAAAKTAGQELAAVDRKLAKTHRLRNRLTQRDSGFRSLLDAVRRG